MTPLLLLLRLRDEGGLAWCAWQGLRRGGLRGGCCGWGGSGRRDGRFGAIWWNRARRAQGMWGFLLSLTLPSFARLDGRGRPSLGEMGGMECLPLREHGWKRLRGLMRWWLLFLRRLILIPRTILLRFRRMGRRWFCGTLSSCRLPAGRGWRSRASLPCARFLMGGLI